MGELAVVVKERQRLTKCPQATRFIFLVNMVFFGTASLEELHALNTK